MKWRILYITAGEGILFQGPRSLVENADDAREFVVSRGDDNEIDKMFEVARDAIFLSMTGMISVRFISEAMYSGDKRE